MNASKLRRDIAAVTTRHCRLVKQDQPGEAAPLLADEAAAEIVLAYRWALRRQLAWKPSEEVARLQKIGHSLGLLIGDIADLPEPLRIALSLDSARTGAAPRGIITALTEIREAAKPGLLSAKKEAQRGIAIDARHTSTDSARAGAVLAVCRRVWRRRTGAMAPSTINVKRFGPFHRYVAAVFEALRIKTSVRTAETASKHWQRRVKAAT